MTQNRLTRRLTAMAAIIALVSIPEASEAQQGGVTGGATRGGTNNGGGAAVATDGAVNTSAGSSDQISRDFGDGLVGRGDTAGRFVGNENATNTGAANQAPTNFQNLNRQRAEQSQPTGSPIRARIVIGFDASLFQSENLRNGSVSLAARPTDVGASALAKAVPSTRVELRSDGTAVMTGRVETSRERKLAEALVRLEPGVRRVENRMTVDPIAPPLP